MMTLHLPSLYPVVCSCKQHGFSPAVILKGNFDPLYISLLLVLFLDLLFFISDWPLVIIGVVFKEVVNGTISELFTVVRLVKLIWVLVVRFG